MFMPQTIEEYLENPMGKGSTAISNRTLIKNDLDSRYQKLLDRYKDFYCKCYYEFSDIYIHVKIPSESERENTYDVVIQFIASEKEVLNDINLNRYTFKVFSNCPSFTYTYAYVYNDYDMIIDFLKNKYSNVVLRDNPIVKNPGEIINFEKSIYFACKYIYTNKSKFLNKAALSLISTRINKQQFSKTIRNTDAIELEIKKENAKLKEAKKKNEQKLADASKTGIKKLVNKLTGTKKSKQRDDHRITPHAKIKGKPKVKSTVKK